MINLETLFKNFFDFKEVSNKHFSRFAFDHIGKLRTNSTGPASFVGGTAGEEIAALATATQEAYDNFLSSIDDDRSNMATQKAATYTVNELLDMFKDFVSRQEGLIRSKFSVTSAQYLDIFPKGVSEYRNASKTTAEGLIKDFRDKCTKYATQLGADLVSEATNFYTNYMDALVLQNDQKGKVKDIKDDKGDFRTALEIQLCKNIHVIGALFPTDVHKCMKFFDQSIIRTERNFANDGIGRAVGTITGNGMPVVGATVSYVGMNMPVVHSKADGTYKGRNVPIGMHQVQVSAPGFQTFTGSINVVDDGDTELNVVLQAVAG